METFKNEPVLTFSSASAWRDWLDAHHADAGPVWLKIHKKGSGLPTVTYAEALDTALCYGWIDSTKQKYDEASFLQRFGARQARSLWSKVNREHVARLIDAGKMTPAGLAPIEAARRDGRWEAAYDSPSQATVPEDFQRALDQHPQAKAFFEGLNKANRYAFVWRIQTVKKAETRAKKIAWAIELLGRQEKLH